MKYGTDISLSRNRLGIFVMESTTARVTDPCYDESVGCTAMITNIRRGTWYADAWQYRDDDWGTRNAYLVISHADLKWDEICYDLEAFPKAASDQIGVDSGRAGFFDDAFYAPDESLADEMVQAHGVFCASGYGDGCYVCTVLEEDGEIVAAMLSFIFD